MQSIYTHFDAFQMKKKMLQIVLLLKALEWTALVQSRANGIHVKHLDAVYKK